MGMKTSYQIRRLILTAFLVLAALAMGAGLLLTAGDPPPTAETTRIRAVTTQHEIDRTVAGDTPVVLVDFHASWCGPCKLLAPELRAMAAAHPKQITIVTVDVDDAPELAQRYQVESIPHLVLMRRGQPMESRRGFASRDVLAQWAGLNP